MARQVREHYKLVSSRVQFSDVRKIYGAQGIGLTLWPGKVRNVRGACFNDELGVKVFFRRYTLAAWIALAAVVILLAYKIGTIGW